jgi:hypothetical protein
MEASPPCVIDEPILPHDTGIRSPWSLGHCSRQLSKTCADVNMLYWQAEYVFILKHYFSSESFCAVHEAFSVAYPDNGVPNKKTIHPLETTFQDAGSVCLWQMLIE